MQNFISILKLLPLLILVYCCFPCSAVITSNTHQNDADYQNLSPPPTYFIQQGGYADENTTLWVDKTGIVTWITNNNKLQKQNLVDLLPSFNFSCTVIETLNGFPSNSVKLTGAVVVYQCGKTRDTAQDFFFCPQYNCYPIINATRFHYLTTPSAIVFRKDSQGGPTPSELYIYNMLTKQGMSKMVTKMNQITRCGEYMIVRYSINTIFVYNPSTGYQTEKIGSVIVRDTFGLVIYTEGLVNQAMLITDEYSQPNLLNFPSDYDTLTIEFSEAVSQYILLQVNKKRSSPSTAFVAFVPKKQQFVEVKCPNNVVNAINFFTDINAMVLTDAGLFNISNDTETVTFFWISTQTCSFGSFNGKATPFARTFPGTRSYFKVGSENLVTLIPVNGSLTKDSQLVPNNSNFNSMTTLGSCQVFSDSLHQREQVYHTNMTWIYNITGFSVVVQDPSNNIRVWFNYESGQLYTSYLMCFPNGYAVPVQTQLVPIIPKSDIGLYTGHAFVRNTRLLLFNSTTFVEIDLLTGLNTLHSNRRFIGVVTDSVTNQPMHYSVILDPNIFSMHAIVSDGTSIVTADFGTLVTSLDIYSKVADNRVIVGPQLATGIPELHVLRGFNYHSGFYTGGVGYDTISYSNNRMTIFGPTTKKGIFYDCDTEVTVRTEYTKNTASISFSSPSATGYAAMISPQQQKGEGSKMAVYSVCQKDSDCTAGDVLTYGMCVNNVCRYTACPPENPFVCPYIGSGFFCAASIVACHL